MIGSATLKLAAQQSISSLKLSEWRALLMALLLAISIASLMAVLGERIERTLMRQGSELLGADLILSSSRPLNPAAITQAQQLGLEHSEVTQLATMANFEDQFLLVTVRALSAPYPRGQIELDQPADELPAPGKPGLKRAYLNA